MKEFLETLLMSLNRVEVRGKENMDIMLGCMMAIDKALKQLDTPNETEGSTDG